MIRYHQIPKMPQNPKPRSGPNYSDGYFPYTVQCNPTLANGWGVVSCNEEEYRRQSNIDYKTSRHLTVLHVIPDAVGPLEYNNNFASRELA